MISSKEAVEEYTRTSIFKNILETYEEIAASRMQNTRSSVLQGRSFIDELNYIFQQVKSSYREDVERMMKGKKVKDPKSVSFLTRNGKSLFVLISSNTGLYGDIIRKTFNLFKSSIEKEKADAAIIGRVGQEYFKNLKTKIPYTFFEMPDATIDNENLRKIVNYIIQYERVFVVYGRFENVINQEPVITNVSGDPLPQKDIQTRVKYFFEPSLNKILEFFEATIFSSLFEQAIFESQLAKFASRMTSLELRVEAIKEALKKIDQEKEKIRHRIINKKQLETFSSIPLWQ